MPKDDTGRLLEQQALSFVASELHASLRYFFTLPKECSEETKSFLLAQAKAALDKMAHAMLNDGKSKWLVKDSFTVADAYAYVCLGWLKLPMINIDISQWPVLKEYRDRISNMDAVKAAELRMSENPKTVVA
jgi:glutathione S-transferase